MVGMHTRQMERRKMERGPRHFLKQVLHEVSDRILANELEMAKKTRTTLFLEARKAQFWGAS